jgi:hypothetical protein
MGRRNGVRMRGSAAILLALVLAGCGGGGKDSDAAEERAALTKWTQAADADCKKANRAIAKRGFPVSLVDLDRLTVRAIADVQGATKAIRARKPPAGSAEKVKPFVESLRGLDAAMKKLSAATEDFRTAKVDRFLPEFGGTLQRVASAAKKLGLRECASHDENIFVPDAIRAPVFAQQLADLDRKLTRRTKRMDTTASTPAQAARNMRALAGIADTYARRLEDLKPPFWARKESDRYVSALRVLGRVLSKGAKELKEPPITPAEASAYDRELTRASRAERKGIKKLLKDIGAVPSLGGGGGGEEAPAGNDSQSA